TQPALRDYEDSPLGGRRIVKKKRAIPPLSTVEVTDEAAAGGNQSLRITEQPGLEHGFEPYITYMLDQEDGLLELGLDLRCDEGGPFVFECRDDPHAYSLGPQLTVDAEGWLSANGERLLQLPRGEWARLDIACILGEESTGTYDLTVTTAGDAPREFNDLAHAEGFSTLACVVIMSTGDDDARFYIDNLTFQREEAP
ncbi:MAG TPA: hypothetical protein QGH10_16990, partial [Armatimonadota bacterium]|nr:hypothetical protein [Armatimonadota bacterium]